MGKTVGTFRFQLRLATAASWIPLLILLTHYIYMNIVNIYYPEFICGYYNSHEYICNFGHSANFMRLIFIIEILVVFLSTSLSVFFLVSRHLSAFDTIGCLISLIISSLLLFYIYSGDYSSTP